MFGSSDIFATANRIKTCKMTTEYWDSLLSKGFFSFLMMVMIDATML